MGQPLISARGVSRSFQAGDETITVLRDIDVDIWPGEMVAIIGGFGLGQVDADEHSRLSRPRKLGQLQFCRSRCQPA